MTFTVSNTLTHTKEAFKPLEDEAVKMYSCGPTVYDYAHIGNFRSFIFTDILKRYLRYKGYTVNHIMNITDVDDKTIRNSRAKGESLSSYTQYYTDAFMKDIHDLRIEPADVMPKATDTIPEMVELVKTLMDKGHAYKSSDGSIYFNISSLEGYGKLSNTKVDELKSGARVSQDEYEKDHAADFVLWKAYTEEDGDVFWETELGKGRPGWHLECSAMSRKFLGDMFDIHTGGVDLVFPHHENEIAQTEAATGKQMARYWLHCEFLKVEGNKMSKSLGNFFTLRDVLAKGYSHRAIRYVLLATHYKQQLNFTFDGLTSAEHTLQRIDDVVRKLREVTKEESSGVDELLTSAKEQFTEQMDDDLNTSAALAVLFDLIRDVNRKLERDEIGTDDAQNILETFKAFDSVLGVFDWTEDTLPDELMEKIRGRENARAEKDFKTADKLRDELLDEGIVLEDTKDGTRWKRA